MLSVAIMPIVLSVSIKCNILSVVMMNVTIKPIILSDIYTVCVSIKLIVLRVIMLSALYAEYDN